MTDKNCHLSFLSLNSMEKKMKKILLSGFVNILCALDVSAMLDPSLEAQNTPVTKILKYSELSELQMRLLHPVPTKEKI